MAPFTAAHGGAIGRAHARAVVSACAAAYCCPDRVTHLDAFSQANCYAFADTYRGAYTFPLASAFAPSYLEANSLTFRGPFAIPIYMAPVADPEPFAHR
jgi:hypothetical protein